VTGWRDRLAALRAADAAAVGAESADSKERIASAQPVGAKCTIGTDIKRTEQPALPDPDHAERAAMAAHYASMAGLCAHVPGDTDPLHDGLLCGFRAVVQHRLM
jgi:hypothetical protein